MPVIPRPSDIAPGDWQRLPWSVGPAAQELAHSEAMLVGLNAPTLRWYLIQPDALVLGASQKLEQIDLVACQRVGLTVHRRQAGGTAVLATADLLNLDIALPPGHPLLLSDIGESSHWLGDMLTVALCQLGVPARVATRDDAAPFHGLSSASSQLDPVERATRLACYGGLAAYEVVVDRSCPDPGSSPGEISRAQANAIDGGRTSGKQEPAKVVGVAQFRRRAGAVFPCGILLRWTPERLAPLIAPDPDIRHLVKLRLSQRAVGLDTLMRRPVSAVEIVTAVETALLGNDGDGRMVHDVGWTSEQLSIVAEKAQHRYQLLNV